MSILVTGAGGYIGSYVSKELRENEFSIIEAKRGTFDYENIETIRSFFAMHDVEQVVHLAGAIMEEEVYDYYKMNVTGLMQFLKVCIEEGVKHFVFISGNNVYNKDSATPHKEDEVSNPLEMDIYGRTKYIGELIVRDMCEEAGIAYTILRVGDVYGSGQKYGNLMKTVLQQAAIGENLCIYGEGKRTRDYIHVCDVARGINFCLKKGLIGTYNLATGIGTSTEELVTLVAKLSGGRSEIQRKEQANEDTSCVILNMDKLYGEGFETSVPLEENLKTTLEGMMKN